MICVVNLFWYIMGVVHFKRERSENMGKTVNQKMKLIYLMDILNRLTDEEHGITMAEIIEELNARGVSAERKAIYTDIELLDTYGFEIEKYKKNGTYLYKALTRKLEVSELKLLVDAVQASKFISENKSNELIKKLEGFASKYQANSLQRQVFVTNRVKTNYESVYYNIDALHEAINKNRKIDFDYYEWTLDKKMELRENGNKKGISPWTLAWDDENYYLIAYDKQAEMIKHYRVDKMRKISILDELRDGKEAFVKFDAAGYAKQVFGMFTGETKNVQIEFDNKLIGVVMDRFGQDAMVIPHKNGKFTINVNVAVSNMFLSWIIGLGTGAKILGPEDVVQKMKNMIAELNEMYSD